MPSSPTTLSLFPESRPASRPVMRPATSSGPVSGKWISAHCDGGARGNPGPAGFGALIQDADGAVIAELSEFLGIQTNNFAEYSGLLASLDFALSNGHPRLRVVSDSELMVKQIQGSYKVKSSILRPLYDQARKKIAQLEGFQITHALRHKNKDADRLANQAMDRGMRRG
jgi:ribonuclease HI